MVMATPTRARAQASGYILVSVPYHARKGLVAASRPAHRAAGRPNSWSAAHHARGITASDVSSASRWVDTSDEPNSRIQKCRST